MLSGDLEHLYALLSVSVQSTIAISKLVSATLDQRDYNLKKSLTSIATFAAQDSKMKVLFIVGVLLT